MILDDFQGLQLLLSLCSMKFSTISMIVFGMFLLPEENQQPILEGHGFSEEK